MHQSGSRLYHPIFVAGAAKTFIPFGSPGFTPGVVTPRVSAGMCTWDDLGQGMKLSLAPTKIIPSSRVSDGVGGRVLSTRKSKRFPQAGSSLRVMLKSPARAKVSGASA